MSGTLYLCATPIGNLEDITLRVIRVLSQVDLIAAEDTRNSLKLLNHLEIKKPLTSYHEHNKYDKAKVLVERLLAGEDIALISDAGTPGISDPGEELVKLCQGAKVQVTALPGPCAAVTALSLAGLPSRRFAFEGFLPTGKKEKRLLLESLKEESRTIIFYEAPHRLLKTLISLEEALGNRPVSICKELTKRFENVLCMELKEAIAYYEKQSPKGEYVLIVQGRDEEELEEEKQAHWQGFTIEAHMDTYLKQGLEKKEAMRQVAKDRGVSKRDIYSLLLRNTQEEI